MKRILILLTFLNIAALCYSQSSCFNSYIDDANKEIKKQTEKGYKEAIRLLKECNYVCKDKPSTGLEQIKSMIKNCEDELNCFVSKIKEVDSLIEISKYETALYILENIDCNIRPNNYSTIIKNKEELCKNGIARQKKEKVVNKTDTVVYIRHDTVENSFLKSIFATPSYEWGLGFLLNYELGSDMAFGGAINGAFSYNDYLFYIELGIEFMEEKLEYNNYNNLTTEETRYYPYASFGIMHDWFTWSIGLGSYINRFKEEFDYYSYNLATNSQTKKLNSATTYHYYLLLRPSIYITIPSEKLGWGILKYMFGISYNYVPYMTDKSHFSLSLGIQYEL